MKLTLKPIEINRLVALLLEFCFAIRESWIPDQLRSVRPRLCAILQFLKVDKTDLEVDQHELEALREACRFVRDELGPDSLWIRASMTFQDVDDLDAALGRISPD